MVPALNFDPANCLIKSMQDVNFLRHVFICGAGPKKSVERNAKKKTTKNVWQKITQKKKKKNRLHCLNRIEKLFSK